MLWQDSSFIRVAGNETFFVIARGKDFYDILPGTTTDLYLGVEVNN
jgi:hypothetical protein